MEENEEERLQDNNAAQTDNVVLRRNASRRQRVRRGEGRCQRIGQALGLHGGRHCLHHGQFKSELAVLSTTGRKGRKGFEYDSSAGLEDLLTCVQPSTQGPHLIPWRHPKSIADARKLDRASLLILVAITEHSGARSWTSFNKSSAPARNSITASICAKASLAFDCV